MSWHLPHFYPNANQVTHHPDSVPLSGLPALGAPPTPLSIYIYDSTQLSAEFPQSLTLFGIPICHSVIVQTPPWGLNVDMGG